MARFGRQHCLRLRHGCGFTGQDRFVGLESSLLQEAAIGGDTGSAGEEDHIARYQVGRINLPLLATAQDAGSNLCESLKRA